MSRGRCLAGLGALLAAIGFAPPTSGALRAPICYVSSIPTEHGYRAGAFATCDLDGDGIVDSVTVVFHSSSGPGELDRLTLTIAGQSIEDRGENLDGTFAIADIDTSDARLEIAIPASGPSFDYSTAFYDFREGRPTHIGTLPGSFELHADGSGAIRTRVTAQVLCTWDHDAEYRLNAEREFVLVPQPRYPMNIKVTMLRPLTLPPLPGRRDGPVALRRGDTVTLVSSDDRSWVDVESPSGRIGRLSIDDLGRLGGTRWEAKEIFAGLPMAD